MTRGEPPKVVVISNKYDARWEQELSSLGVGLQRVQCFSIYAE